MKQKKEAVLFRPLLYRNIILPNKELYDTYIPLIAGGAAAVLYYFSNGIAPLWEQHGIIANIQLILTILPGFFITALAAIATFDKPTLDGTMHGDPPKVICSDLDNEIRERILTRRRFLCLLFGYLSLVTFLLYIFGAALDTINETLSQLLKSKIHYQNLLLYFRVTALFLYITCFANIVTTTLLGLFYLSDRLHWFEPKPYSD
ncbi:hypothetical protein [Halodesulfovibrio sp.]|uniref:hypothetical protein n=1 Tax=Halodesulfovibrio sp. TaxID=1912772 RepID=UPI0025BF642D|nr:hypothetical protein [Halodesulfovibrio sp.]